MLYYRRMGALVPRFLKRTHNVIFDIGSASVGVAITRHDGGDAIEVLFTHRERIPFGKEKNAAALGSYLQTAIETAATAVLDALGTVEHIGGDYQVHAIAHAPWVDSRSERAESMLPDEILITKEVLQQYIVRQFPQKEQEGRIEFDRHVIRIELNGYATTQPYKKRATQIAVTILKSSMAEPVYAGITNAFKNTFPNHTVHIDAFLFAVTQLRELFGESDAFTIIDIGGEYTSLSVVREGTISGNVWAPFGTNHLVRAVAQGNEVNRHSAVSALSMYLSNSCTPAQCRKIEELLKKSEEVWVREFGAACTTLSKLHRLPTRTFVSVDRLYIPWFKKAIERPDFGQFTVTGKPLNAQLLTTEHALQSLHFAESATYDSLLSLAALFVDK